MDSSGSIPTDSSGRIPDTSIKLVRPCKKHVKPTCENWCDHFEDKLNKKTSLTVLKTSNFANIYIILRSLFLFITCSNHNSAKNPK